MTRRDGEVLFGDRFDGSSTGRWPIPPISLTDDPAHGRALHLKAGDPNAAHWLGWVGDETWRNYRLEMDVLPVGEGNGFLGFDFHVQDDGSGCCNLHFPALPEGGDRRFEGCGRYDDANTSWKLGPLSQRTAPVVPGGWMKLRLDAGGTVANLYVDDGPDPVFTIYDLPFPSGGIRLWRYHASGLFRNLRVTSSRDVEPILDDTWGSVAGPGVIRDWWVSRMLPQGFGSDDPVAAARAEDMGWRKVSGDRRGVVNVVGIDPAEYLQKGRRFRARCRWIDRGGRAPASPDLHRPAFDVAERDGRVRGKAQGVERSGQDRSRRRGQADTRPVRGRASAGVG